MTNSDVDPWYSSLMPTVPDQGVDGDEMERRTFTLRGPASRQGDALRCRLLPSG
jgi:hypothetical protein